MMPVGRVNRESYNNWFNKECEWITALKNESYKRMLQKNHTRNAVEEYHKARREEKRLHERKKGNTEDKN